MHVILAIAGSDSSGCAGLQADIRAITAGGGHAASVLTCVTAQSSMGLSALFPLPREIVERQLEVVFADLPVKAVKSGALGSVDAVEAVGHALHRRQLPYVLDPVLTTSSGGALAVTRLVAAMRDRLFPLATLLTPNAVEAEVLTGLNVRDRGEAARAGTQLLQAGCGAVLVKGGHLRDDPFVDVLVEPSGHTFFEGSPLSGSNTRGTGCTLASTIATHLGAGLPLREAIVHARDHLRRAILGGYFLPGGGPVDAFAPRRQSATTSVAHTVEDSCA